MNVINKGSKTFFGNIVATELRFHISFLKTILSIIYFWNTKKVSERLIFHLHFRLLLELFQY